VDENDNCQVSKLDAASRAKAAFKTVFINGSKIELDHHLVYHSRRFTNLIYSGCDYLTSHDQIMNSAVSCLVKAMMKARESSLILFFLGRLWRSTKRASIVWR